MEMGILGLPQSGKSTLFEIMTGTKSSQLHTETVCGARPRFLMNVLTTGGNISAGESLTGESSVC